MAGWGQARCVGMLAADFDCDFDLNFDWDF